MNSLAPLLLRFVCSECGSTLQSLTERECPAHPLAGIVTIREEPQSYVLIVNGVDRIHLLSEEAATQEATRRRTLGQSVEVLLRRAQEVTIDRGDE